MIQTLSDGRLLFPQRGGPPKVPDGYDRDPNDPYIMIPCYDACTQRIVQPQVMPCGRINHKQWCKLHNCEATPDTCMDCPDVDFGAVESNGTVHDIGVSQEVILTS